MRQPIHILLIDDDPAEEIIMRRLFSKVSNLRIELHYRDTIEGAVSFIKDGNVASMVLIDNRLQPQCDFRETVPTLRKNGYIGPVGVISSSLSDAYFEKFEEYGADFRIGKTELDQTAIEFILREYVVKS